MANNESPSEESGAALLAGLSALHGDAECPLNDFTLVSGNGLEVKVDTHTACPHYITPPPLAP